MVWCGVGAATPGALLYEYPENLRPFEGLCVVAGSPDERVPVERLEQLVEREARTLRLPVRRMDAGPCVPMKLKTGNAWLVMSLEVLPVTPRGGWITKVRVSDPRARVVVWEHDAFTPGAVDAVGAWTPALKQLAATWALSRSMK